MANVIRQDVVQIGFDVENNPLQKITDEINKLKSAFAAFTGQDVLDEVAENAQKAQGAVGDLADETKNVGKSAGGLKQLKANIQQTVTALTGGEKGVKGFTNALKNIGKISLEKLKSGLKTISSKLSEIAKKASGAAFNGLKKLAGISFKALGAGLAAGTAGAGALVYKAVQSYANYEQLVGGVETLFKDSAGIVQKYANEAYKAAGLSANRYMETATSFSAAMINSVGGSTAEAAELTNMAITDMSDNANKMGTDMESIIQTYQSLSRGNYGMLDNLKLGYGGTKEEMSRLINEAAKLDKSVKANDTSFGNIAKAINVIQKDMGISGITYKEYTELVESGAMTHEEAFEKLGTTAKEANFTISGSFNQLKGAWENMLTAFVSGGDGFDQCIDNLIESAEIFAGNVGPAIEKAMSGLGKFIEKIAPMIAEKLPGIIEQLLPPLVSAAGQLIASLARNIGPIIESLIPVVKEAAAQVIAALYEGFTGKKLNPDGIEKIRTAVDGLCKTAKWAGPTILGLVVAFKGFNKIKSGAKAVKDVADGIGKIAQKVTGGVTEKIKGVGDGIDDTGKKSKTSSKNLLASAKAFMMLAASVALIAVGFGILAFAAIKLAAAGPLAIGVMFGLIVVMAALGFGMTILLKTISTLGVGAIQGAAAMAILGVAIILVAVGFAIMAQAAIALSSAGGAAIGVMFGMIAAIAVLVVIVGLFGGGLIAGAVGFAIFSVGLLICAAAAYVFAMAVERMTPPLLMLIPVVGQVVTQIVNAIGTTLVNCIQAAGTAISGILDSIGNIFLKFGEGVKEIVTGIGDAISGVLDSVAGIFDSIGNAALNAGLGFEKVANGLRMISEMSLTELIASLGSVGKALGTLAENGEGLTLAGQGMQTLVAAFMSLATTGAMVSTVITGVATALNQLTMTMPNLVAILPSLVAPLTMVASQFMLFATTVTSAVTSITMTLGLLTGVVTILAALANALNTGTTALNEMSGASEQLSKTFEASMKGMVNGAQSGTTRILSLIKQMLSDIQTAFKSVNLQSVGEQMMNGLIRGINNKRAELISLIRSVANEANREWQAIQAIHSPSKVWEQFGEYQIEGNIVGMENKLPQLRRAVDDVGEAAIPYSSRYSPEGSVSYTNSRSSRVEHNSYSPVFNFNISGGGDTRATARAVKRAAKEAVNEMFESMSRRTPMLQTY